MCLHDALTEIITQDNQELFIEFINKHQSQTFSCDCTYIYFANDITLFSLLKSIAVNAIKILKYLLESNLINKKCFLKWTPLHYAAHACNKEIVELLLTYNADPNAQSKKKLTPLHLATRKGCQEIVELLLKYNADINAQDSGGWTPLHHATYNGNKDIVELLLKYDANPNLQNNNKNIPLYFAAHNCDEDIFNILYPKTDQKYRNDKTVLEYMKKLVLSILY